MPKVRTKRTRVPPGFELLEETLDALERRMREVESAPHEGKRRNESIWPVFRIHHQRSRFIFDMHYTRGAIDRACFDFCVKEGYADAALCAKWRKPGFMNLCCMTCVPPFPAQSPGPQCFAALTPFSPSSDSALPRCVSTKAHNYGTVCICRVPRKDLDAGKIFECPHCGCRGCADGDAGAKAALPEAVARALAASDGAAAGDFTHGGGAGTGGTDAGGDGAGGGAGVGTGGVDDVAGTKL